MNAPKFALIALSLCFLLACYAQEAEKNDSDDEPPHGCNLIPSEALDSYDTVEDFECCAPYLLPDYARLYYQTGAGRQVTLLGNKIAYKRYRIIPNMMVDVSQLDLSVNVLGHKISMPVAIAPVGFLRFASDLGEIDAVRAAQQAGTLMVLSSYGTTLIEDLRNAAPKALKWMQTYIFPNRSQTVDLVRRAEAAGYKAIVVTVDSPIPGPLPNNARGLLDGNPKNLTTVNLSDNKHMDTSQTFKDLKWVKRLTKLPIVAKGILTPEDAVRAVRVGASAIYVSNHGGRQLDNVPATVDVLPNIVNAVKRRFPNVEVYVDGGVRNGFDVFKALAQGADLVLNGRPIVWGLAAGGQKGVKKILDIFRRELNETMTLAGTPNVKAISKDMIVPGPCCTDRDNILRTSYLTVKTCHN